MEKICIHINYNNQRHKVKHNIFQLSKIKLMYSIANVILYYKLNLKLYNTTIIPVKVQIHSIFYICYLIHHILISLFILLSKIAFRNINFTKQFLYRGIINKLFCNLLFSIMHNKMKYFQI